MSSLRETLTQFIIEASSFTFRPGEIVKNIDPIRLVPHPNREGTFFGGSITGTRGRGSTEATFPPDSSFKVLERIGSAKALVKDMSGDVALPIEVHMNQFSAEAAEKYRLKLQRAKEESAEAAEELKAPAKKELSPEEELKAAMADMEAAKEAYLAAKKRAKIAELMLSNEDLDI